MKNKRVDIKTGFLCNNNCFFCVQAHKKMFGNRPTADIKKDLEAAKKSGCDGVVFTGGEASIRQDILELARYAKRLGFQNIQLQTNARVLSNNDNCIKFIKAGVNEFGPALHGHNARLHDRLTRAPGSFEQTVRAIKNLKKLNQYVITNTVVVKPNYRFLPQIAELLIGLGVDQYQFAFVHAVGNAALYYDKMMPRVSLAAPYIKKGLQAGIDKGVPAMAEAMPLCTMSGYEKYCSEFFIPDTEVRDINSYDPDFKKTRREEGKMKFAWCRQCAYDNICEGPWKEYPEKMGTGEFRPVKKTAEEKNKNKRPEGPSFSGSKNASAKINSGRVMPGAMPPKFKQILDRMFLEDNYNFVSLALALFGKKKISRMCLTKDEVREVRPYLEYYRIHYEVVPRAQTASATFLESAKSKNNYIIDSDDLDIYKKRNQYLLISQDKDLIAELKEAEIKGAHNIGTILGYPKCCVDFYNSISQGSDIAVWNKLVANSPKKENNDIVTNTLRINRTVLMHFPCSLDCKNSLKQGKDFFETFLRLDPKYADVYKEDLAKPVFLANDFLINFEEDIKGKKDITNFHTKGIKARVINWTKADKIKLDGKLYSGRTILFK